MEKTSECLESYSGKNTLSSWVYRESYIIRDFWDLEKLVLRETSLAETMINEGFSGPKNRVNIVKFRVNWIFGRSFDNLF